MLIKRVLASLLGLVVGIGLIELVLWILGQPPHGPFLQEYYGQGFKIMCYRENTSGGLDRDLRDRAVRGRYAERLAWTDFQDTWAATPFCVEVQFNSEGFREREIGPKAAGVTRVALIGDSFTYGHGLPEAASLPRQLEALLRREFGDPRFDVLNLGVGAIDLPEVADVGARAIRELDVDLLLYAYFINDGSPLDGLAPASGVHAIMRAGWAHAAGGRGRLSLGARPAGFPRTLRLIARLVEQRRVSGATLAYYRWLHSAENWPKIAGAIERLQHVADSRGARFAVVPLPIPFRMGPDYPLADVQAKIVSGLRSRNIRVVDVLPSLQAHGETELSIHPEDLHPDSRYHGLVARVLYDELFAPR